MKKAKKLIKNPGIFFRDYLNKKYPVMNTEQNFAEVHESLLIENDLKLLKIEQNTFMALLVQQQYLFIFI